MSTRPSPRVAVVTGGSRGIGAATAPLLAAAGWDVCLSYRTAASDAENVVAACTATGRRAVAVQADISVEQDVLHLFAAADELGPLGVLVNNAGITGPKARVDELTVERLERIVAVNVVGAFLCVREAVRRMSTAHGGSGGAIGLAREVAREGVRVNAVRPGLINTDIHASGGQPDRVEEKRDTVPLGRGGETVEVAQAIAWLCSDEASYVTGALLDVSGGR